MDKNIDGQKRQINKRDKNTNLNSGVVWAVTETVTGVVVSCLPISRNLSSSKLSSLSIFPSEIVLQFWW